MGKIAPSNIPYEHNKRWGDGNGFSHVRAALMKPSLTTPVFDGMLTWKHGSRLSSLILTTEEASENNSSDHQRLACSDNWASIKVNKKGLTKLVSP